LVIDRDFGRRVWRAHLGVSSDDAEAELGTIIDGVNALMRGAREMGMAPDSYAIAVLPPPKLFAWAASRSWALAFHLARPPGEPLYVLISPDKVKALARGE
jgi:hypothetical protein